MDRAYEIFADCRDGAFVVDCKQEIALWNAAAASILGHSSAEVLGKPCWEVIRGKDCHACLVCRRGCDEQVSRARRVGGAEETSRRSMKKEVKQRKRSGIRPLMHLDREELAAGADARRTTRWKEGVEMQSTSKLIRL